MSCPLFCTASRVWRSQPYPEPHYPETWNCLLSSTRWKLLQLQIKPQRLTRWRWTNSRKLASSPAFEKFGPRPPSVNPARNALNPITNHLVRSKGLNRAIFIRFHALLRGSKYSMFIWLLLCRKGVSCFLSLYNTDLLIKWFKFSGILLFPYVHSYSYTSPNLFILQETSFLWIFEYSYHSKEV